LALCSAVSVGLFEARLSESLASGSSSLTMNSSAESFLESFSTDASTTSPESRRDARLGAAGGRGFDGARGLAGLGLARQLSLALASPRSASA